MNDIKSSSRTYRKKTPIYKRTKNAHNINNTKINRNPKNKIKIETNKKETKNIDSSTNKSNTKTQNPISTPNIKNLKKSVVTKEDTNKNNPQNTFGIIYKNNSILKKHSLNYRNKRKNNSLIRNQQSLNTDKKTLFTVFIENGQNMMQRNEIWNTETNDINFTCPNEQKLHLKNSIIKEANKSLKTETIKNKNISPTDNSVKKNAIKTTNQANNNKKPSAIKNLWNSAKQRKTKKIFGRNKINLFKKTNLKLKLDYENHLTLNENIISNTINVENQQSGKSPLNLKRNLTSVRLNTQNNHIPHYLENTISAKNKVVTQKKKGTKAKSNSKYKKKLINKINLSSRNSINIVNNYNNKNEEIGINHRGCENGDNKNKKTETNEKKQSFHIKEKEKSVEKKKQNSIIHTPNQRSEILTTSNESSNNINNYIITKELGKGSYASVKLATHKISKNKYAIKIYSRKCLLDLQKRNTINNEIGILKQLDHINIVKLYEVIDTPSYLYLVMEYINGISLLDIIKQEFNHYISQNRALKIFKQVLKAIIYCQSKDISHRDIKLENILVIQNDVVKIIDFGFAVKATKNDLQKLFCGTPSYMSPEIVNKQKYVAQYSDIWSMGVLLFAMLYGRFPFRAKEQDILFDKISKAEVVFPDDVEIDERLKLLFKKIFVIAPTQRPSLNEILNEITIIDK